MENSPVSLPITSVTDLLNIDKAEIEPRKQSFVKLNSEPLPDGPKTLVCHDMKGGYIEDRFDQGCENFDAYNFWFWNNIDVFIYFSHKIVVIPPFVWRVVSHRNNCPILGTFYVDWVNGMVILLELLSPTNFELTLKNLVHLCQIYQFDGYLINIECDVPPDFVCIILKFLNRLKYMLLDINPSSLVIWYDAIIYNGKVIYQDELNYLNSCFFDNSSAFFTNYNWTAFNLQHMCRSVKTRLSDVYVGLDLFPREKLQGMPPTKFIHYISQDYTRIGIDLICNKICTNDSYLGGSCQQIKFTVTPLIIGTLCYVRYQLFPANISIRDPHCVHLVYKPLSKLAHVRLALELVYRDKKLILLRENKIGYELEKLFQKEPDNPEVLYLDIDEDLSRLFTGGHKFNDSWIRLSSTIMNFSEEPSFLMGINLLIIPITMLMPNFDSIQVETYEILLGEISIHPLLDLDIDWSNLEIANISTNHIRMETTDIFKISCELKWDIILSAEYKDFIESIDIFCYINDEYQFVGKSMMAGFYYLDFQTQMATNLTDVHLFLQIVIRSGIRQPIEKCSKINISF
ncbi:hypothetical protein HZS_7012 [Henneguya salminicola]|nr:hypothetical protein HZS_7012 [Henneguya salminicola]